MELTAIALVRDCNEQFAVKIDFREAGRHSFGKLKARYWTRIFMQFE